MNKIYSLVLILLIVILAISSYFFIKEIAENKKENELFEELQEVVGLMDETFITSKGHPNYENINWFKERGYRVFPGEKDSFGWLTAGIQKLGGPVLWFG